VVDVTIKQVGHRDGKDRFVLVHPRTRKVLTVDDVTEAKIRQFFQKKGAASKLLDACLDVARERYALSKKDRVPSVDQGAETIGDDDVLFELGLDDESDASIH
jgi:hypothetical protein